MPLLRRGNTVAQPQPSPEELREQHLSDITYTAQGFIAGNYGTDAIREYFHSDHPSFDGSDSEQRSALEDGIVLGLANRLILTEEDQETLRTWQAGRLNNFYDACALILKGHNQTFRQGDPASAWLRMSATKFRDLSVESGLGTSEVNALKFPEFSGFIAHLSGKGDRGQITHVAETIAPSIGVREIIIGRVPATEAPILAESDLRNMDSSGGYTNLASKLRKAVFVAASASTVTTLMASPASAEEAGLVFVVDEPTGHQLQNLQARGIVSLPASSEAAITTVMLDDSKANKPATSPTAAVPTSNPGTTPTSKPASSPRLSATPTMPAPSTATPQVEVILPDAPKEDAPKLDTVVDSGPSLTMPEVSPEVIVTAEYTLPDSEEETAFSADDIDTLAAAGGTVLEAKLVTYARELKLKEANPGAQSVYSFVEQKLLELERQSTDGRMLDPAMVAKARALVQELTLFPETFRKVKQDDPIFKKLMLDVLESANNDFHSSAYNGHYEYMQELTEFEPTDQKKYSPAQIRAIMMGLAMASAASQAVTEASDTPTAAPAATTTTTLPDAPENPSYGNQDRNDSRGNGNPGNKGNGPGPRQPAPENNGSSRNLGPVEVRNKALAEMERMGPEWRNRAILMRYFMERGYEAFQVAGMIGNFCVEAAGCELDPTIEQFGGGPGRGIVQWGSTEVYEWDRFGHDYPGQPGVEHHGTLRWFAAQHGLQWNDLMTQIRFIEWELDNTQVGAKVRLQDTTNVYEATDVILNYYERPTERIMGPRLTPARATLDMFQKLVRSVEAQNNAGPSHEQPGKGATRHYESGAAIEARLQRKYNGVSGRLHPSELRNIGPAFGSHRLYPAAAETLQQLSQAFEARFGYPIGVTDSYRGFAAQVQCREEKGSKCAVPGTSNHGWGLAADMGEHGVNDYSSPQHQWLRENAPRYGWDLPIWARADGSNPEPWHWEYVGNVRLNTEGGEGRNSLPSRNESREPRSANAVSSQGYGTPVPEHIYVDAIGTRYDGYESMEGTHTGQDFEIPENTPVLAVRRGEVIDVIHGDSDGVGNAVMVRLDNGRTADYQHLNRIAVRPGQKVSLGDRIGLSGNTGNSTGPHLHVTISEPGEGGEWVSRLDGDVKEKTDDPMTLLPSADEVRRWLSTR